MNRWIRLGIVAGVIIALVVVLIILRNPGAADVVETPTYEPDPERVQLLRFPREEIDKIEIQTEEGGLAIVRTEDDTFLPVYKPVVRFAESRINRIVSGAASLSSQRIIDENPGDLSDYGLDEPFAQVTVSSSESDPATLLVGNQNPAKDAYYAKLANDPVVYTVYKTWIDPFLVSLDELRDKSLHAITPLEITEMQIQNTDGRNILVEQRPEDDDDPEMIYNAYSVTEPFRRAMGVNSTWMEEITNLYAALAIDRFVDDAPADLAKYGLSPPRAKLGITDSEKAVLLLVGDAAEGGRYARLAGLPSVFVLRGIEEIITTKPYQTISSFGLIVGIDIVDRFVVETPTETFTGIIHREPSEVEGEDPVETYFLNGVETDEDLFRDLYQYAIGLLVDAEAVDPQPGRYVVKITYYLSEDQAGRSPLSVEFAPYDSNFLAMYRDGISEFIIAKSKIDRLLTAYQDAVVQ